MRIDAHQHFWKVERGDYGWLTPSLKPLYRNFLPDDLHPILRAHQIDRTIVIQAAPTVEETDFLLRLYEENEWIAGVVGWLDLESVDFSEIFNHYRQQKGFVGIRPMLQDLADDKWILSPNVLNNIQLLADEDFPLDILIKPRHLPHILEFLRKFPKLRAVVDHLGKPFIADQILDPWRELISEVASFPNVMCKLSGMITEADHQLWKPEHLTPYIEHIVNVFGTNRILFGSDWPVCLLAGSYEDVYNALTSNLPKTLGSEDMERIFGKNALSFYRI